MKVEKVNRYFLVHYAAYLESGAQFLGLSTVMTDGAFINKNRFINDTKAEGKENGQDIKNILPIQIMELTEKDYLDWYE